MSQVSATCRHAGDSCSHAPSYLALIITSQWCNKVGQEEERKMRLVLGYMPSKEWTHWYQHKRGRQKQERGEVQKRGRDQRSSTTMRARKIRLINGHWH